MRPLPHFLRLQAEYASDAELPIRAGLFGDAADEIDRLRRALQDVREEICRGPVNDVLWHREILSETTVDFICNTLGDDWNYDLWLEQEAIKRQIEITN